ncbi:uncharacterized protein [Procambarus clarkii]|uniref:uncharacterized protein isoform X2 n=1 Tax=Procambarus clarkii TaxID=6728 RepID=UPI003742FBA9
MACWCCLLLLLLWGVVVAPLDYGCMVHEEMNVDLLYDSLDFMAYVPPKSNNQPGSSGTFNSSTVIGSSAVPGSSTLSSINQSSVLFTALMKCDSNADYDFLSVTSSSVRLVKYQRRNQSVVVDTKHEAAGRVGGWEQFSLGVVGEYTLTDGQGQAWLPPGITIDCQVGSMKVKDGLLMRQCPAGTPTWKVTDTKRVSLLLVVGPGDGESRQNLKLFSKTNFTPTFNAADAKFVLGWRNGALSTVDTMNPLPPLKWHGLLLVLAVTGPTTTLTVMSGKHKVYQARLAALPQYLVVTGRPGDTFLLHSPNTNAALRHDHHHPPLQGEGVTVVVLGALLGTAVVVLLSILARDCCRRFQPAKKGLHQSQSQRVQPHSSCGKMSRPETQYLQPLPALPSSPSPCLPLHNATDDMEHQYAELEDPCFLTLQDIPLSP